jgi:hypothetical protein
MAEVPVPNTAYAPYVVTFVVEAYLSKSHRLLWRATRTDRSDAYWLALRAEADPRLEVTVVEIRSDASELRSTGTGTGTGTGRETGTGSGSGSGSVPRLPVPAVIPLATRSRRPKPWLACS